MHATQWPPVHWFFNSGTIILAMLAGSVSSAQPTDIAPPDRVAIDTVRVDTTGNEGFILDSRLSDSTLAARNPLDSTALKRSRIPAREGKAPGSIVDQDAPEATLVEKRSIVWMEYLTLFDVLSRFLPAYPLSQGGAGLVQTFSFLGSDPSSVGYLYNGRPLRGTNGHVFDIEVWPVEFLERIEIVRGARAMIYGPDDGFVTVNLVQPRFDVEGSYIRAWYRQGINSTTGGDITYARNIGQAMNLALGFRRIRSDGVFLERNYNVSSWNGRGALTWYPRRGLTFSLSELFTDATRGQNGGLTDNSSRDPFSLQVMNLVRSERTLRHDVTLNGRYYPFLRPAAATDNSFDDKIDSSLVVDAAFYYTADERFTDDNGDSSDALESSDVFGARGALQWRVGSVLLEGTGHTEMDLNEDFDFDAGGLVTYFGDVSGTSPADPLKLQLRGGARLYEVYDGARFGLAGEIIFRKQTWDLRGTLRHTTVLTEPEFDMARDTMGYFSDVRTPFLVETELTVRQREIDVSLSTSYRRARPRGSSEPYGILGASLRADVPLGNGLHFRNLGILTIAPATDIRFPLIYDIAETFGHWALLKGNLDLQIGTSFQFQSRFDGTSYDPASGEFLQRHDVRGRQKLLFPVWDAYLEARLGMAYVRLAFRNILDNEFYTIYRYPITGRGFYLGANWAFVD